MTVRGRRWGHAAVTATAFAGAALAVLSVDPLTASADEITTRAYSTDGGATWSTRAPAKTPGQQVLVRNYYVNTGSSDRFDASVSTTLPAGYGLVPGSTRTCLNPGTTDVTHPNDELRCNTDPGMGGPIDEAAVWQGSTLRIAPNAGLYGESTSATSGLMAVGRVRYLNLHECGYSAGQATTPFTILSNVSAELSTGTFTSNTPETSPVCGPGNAEYQYQPANSAAQPVDLMGYRYVNLQQCSYGSNADGGDSLFGTWVARPGDFTTGTSASNTPVTSPSCGPGNADHTFQPQYSASQTLDLMANNVLYLAQCSYSSPGSMVPFQLVVDHVPGQSGDFSTSTHTSSAVPDPLLRCGAGNADHALQPSTVDRIPLYAPNRGQGFVEFVMVADDTTEADLGISKAGPANVSVGQAVTYTLVVTNAGPSDSSGYTVTDRIPAGLTNVTTSTPGCAIANLVLTCTGGPLPLRQSATIEVTGTADGAVTTLFNTATVTGQETDPNPGNNTSNEVRTEVVPLMSLSVGAGALALTGFAVRRRAGRKTSG
ncbi:DUF11 domain-containing protein [Amycolatopsis sacchari]|uniref:DUF11 domain-containing protein n=1 Tax=Amycolatopsis sacchari TaxID=115433 RepID=UPI003EC10541